MVLPLLITLPLEVVKFDLGGDWAMVTVVFWPLLNEVYWARYVRLLAWLMLLVSALTFSGEFLAAAGSAGERATAPRPRATVRVAARVRMTER